MGQARVDVPTLRSLESAICADVDVEFGDIIAGNHSYVIHGFNVPIVPSPIGVPATLLTLNTVGGTLAHPLASESGTIYTSSATAVDILNSAINSNVTGSFSANTTNYVGVDLIRTANPLTSDSVSFLPANAATTGAPVQEITKVVPTGRLLQYSIVIQANTFSSSTNILPIAIVVTDKNNNVVSVEDARPMLYRLGTGGDLPNPSNRYPWASGRLENPITFTTGSTQDPFVGGDKQITSLKGMLDAITSRLQEVGGGNFWYSPTSNLNIKLLRIGASFTDGDNFQTTANSSTSCVLAWQGLYLAIDSNLGIDPGTTSPEYTNRIEISDNAVGVTIEPGQCLYVDINRADTTFANLTANIINLDNFIQPGPPYSRFIIAWAELDSNGITQVFTRDSPYEVGTTGSIATTTAYGLVKLNAPQPNIAVVASVDATFGQVVGYGLSRGNSPSVTNVGSGPLAIGNGSYDTSVTVGGSNATTLTLLGTTININNSSSNYLTNIGNTSASGIVNIKTTNTYVGNSSYASYLLGYSTTGAGFTVDTVAVGVGLNLGTVNANVIIGNNTGKITTKSNIIDANYGISSVVANTSSFSGSTASASGATNTSGTVTFVFGSGSPPSIPSGLTTMFTVNISTAYPSTPNLIWSLSEFSNSTTTSSPYFFVGNMASASQFTISIFNPTSSSITFEEGTITQFTYFIIG